MELFVSTSSWSRTKSMTPTKQPGRPGRGKNRKNKGIRGNKKQILHEHSKFISKKLIESQLNRE